MISKDHTWASDLICIHPTSVDEVQAIAYDIYERTCRTDFSMPGFCVVNVGKSIDSVAFRQLMVDLKCAMAELHVSNMHQTLIYQSAGRFDQQETTRPHLDGGPIESMLMLGYEPSEVDAELEIIDYARCAYDRGLTPVEFLEQHNPMFESNYDLLRDYSTSVPCFSSTDFQIVCINNSSAPFLEDQKKWQGTLHTATILNPDEAKRRVINSTMIASVPVGTPEILTESQQQEFISTATVLRRGYHKSHLEDDR